MGDSLDWFPSPQRVAELYSALATGPGYLELEWKLPPGGRRPPSQQQEQQEEVGKDAQAGEDKEEGEDKEATEAAQDNFDFDDSDSFSGGPGGAGGLLSTPHQRRLPGAASQLRGSARKKTTSLDGVLSNMRRHKIMEEEGTK